MSLGTQERIGEQGISFRKDVAVGDARPFGVEMLPVLEVRSEVNLIENPQAIITDPKTFNHTALTALRFLGSREIAEKVQEVITGPYGSLIGPIGRENGLEVSNPAAIVVGAKQVPTAKKIEGDLNLEKFSLDLYIKAIVANIVAGVGHAITNTWSATRMEDLQLFEEVMKEHLRVVNTVKSVLLSSAKTWITLGPMGESYIYDTKELAEKNLQKTAKLAPTPNFDEALNFWTQRLAVLKKIGGFDTIMAETFPNDQEAKAFVLAAKEVGVPVRISFTLRADGCLLNGVSIVEVIREIDGATAGYSEGFAFNCCPLPAVLAALKDADEGGVLNRVLGFHVNSTDEDLSVLAGLDFGEHHNGLIEENPDLFLRSRVIAQLAKVYGLHYCGGCCGFHPKHTGHIAEQFN